MPHINTFDPLEYEFAGYESYEHSCKRHVLQILGKDHVIKGLQKCDFTPMYDHAMAEREKKKSLSKEVSFCLYCLWCASLHFQAPAGILGSPAPAMHLVFHRCSLLSSDLVSSPLLIQTVHNASTCTSLDQSMLLPGQLACTGPCCIGCPCLRAWLTYGIMLQEKLAIKEKKEKDEAKFKYAQVDGRTEQVRGLMKYCSMLNTSAADESQDGTHNTCYL